MPRRSDQRDQDVDGYGADAMSPACLRLVAATGVGAVLLVSCAPRSASPGDSGVDASRDPTELTREDLTSVLSPDSIPSIDDPEFVSSERAATWLASEEPVAVLEIEGDARGYPLQIMTWHEIVNDVVGGIPVAVTYCPLCNSALAYPRTVGKRVLEFGTSGSLYNSALVMYDRQTESLWLHFEGIAIEGPLEGTRLEFIPVQILSFDQFRDEHPGGKVLSQETGFSRTYGQNPYEFYDTAGSPQRRGRAGIGSQRPFLFEGELDGRMHALARVVGVEIDGDAVAVPYDLLAADGRSAAVHVTIGGQDIVVFWQPGVRSALDNPQISLGRDVGSSGVFLPIVQGRELTFRAEGGLIKDQQTGSTWSLAGRAVSGPLAGEELPEVSHVDSFWFAWSSHNPDTAIFEPPG
jgi:Protein of unknown function (DUF3179)